MKLSCCDLHLLVGSVNGSLMAPVLSDEFSDSEASERNNGTRSVKGRAILLGLFLAILFSAVNGYLSINLGMSFGYGAVAVLLAYSLFHRLGGGSCRRELSFVLISSIAQCNAKSIRFSTSN